MSFQPPNLLLGHSFFQNEMSTEINENGKSEKQHGGQWDGNAFDGFEVQSGEDGVAENAERDRDPNLFGMQSDDVSFENECPDP